MNIRVFLSVLAIVVALFIGGVMAFINEHPVWSCVLWGLAGVLLVISLICYFVQKYKKRTSNVKEHNPNIRWI